MFDHQKLYDKIQQCWQDNIIPSLFDYVKIPNKSPHFDPDWEAHGYMEKATSHIAEYCNLNAPKGMKLEIIRLPSRTPLLFIEIEGQNDETILIYGHLDKQPEMTGWQEGLGPWEPVIKEDRLYGRGSADDGYATYAALAAISALQEQNQPHARCILIIEACEESGSFDLPYYIDALSDRIGKPSLVICLDSGAGNYEQLWMTTSLRGNIVGELSVELLTEGIHSGYGSGIVADSFRVARSLLSRIEDEVTGEIKLPNLYCEIPKDRYNQAFACATILKDSIYSSLPLQPEVKPLSFDEQELLLNRSWRPSLTITGAQGLPHIADAGNVLRPQTALKLSLRIPPLVCPKEASLAIQHILTENPPYGAKVSFQALDSTKGWNAPTMQSWLENAVDEASQIFYGKPAAYIGEGGTIPFMAMLGEKFPAAQFMITGVLGPHSNAHGPNEFLHLDMVKKLTACVSYVIKSHYNQMVLDKNPLT